MDRNEIIDSVRDFLISELSGENVGDLSPDTGLVEAGLLNSFELIRLLYHIETRLGACVPPDKVMVVNFRDLNAIADLVLQLRDIALP